MSVKTNRCRNVTGNLSTSESEVADATKLTLGRGDPRDSSGCAPTCAVRRRQRRGYVGDDPLEAGGGWVE